MNTSGLLFILLCLALIGVLAFAGENRKLRAKLEAKRTRDGYPWDWTKEDERKVRAAMELICDKCHERYMTWDPDKLTETCALCPVPDAVSRLVNDK